jgi:hypothetical protein
MDPSQEPSFLTQMIIGSSSSLPLSIVPHTAPPAPLKSKRDWKDDSTALLMDLFEEKFLANSTNNLAQQEILLRIEEAFPLTNRALGLKFSPNYIKCGRNLIN